jgi:hypothetical protein
MNTPSAMQRISTESDLTSRQFEQLTDLQKACSAYSQALQELSLESKSSFESQTLRILLFRSRVADELSKADLSNEISTLITLNKQDNALRAKAVEINRTVGCTMLEN